MQESSSTSSSKRPGRFIWGSLLFLVLLASGYWVLVAVVQPTWRPVQTQWETNVATVQDFLYQPEAPRVVVIGSSMSRRLLPEYLPEDHFNLSCLGGKVFSLMEIIRRSGKYPELLLVEANSISVDHDRELVEHVFHPMMEPARRRLPILQDRYKPFSLIFGPAINAGARAVAGRNEAKPVQPTAARNRAYKEMVKDANRRLGTPLPQKTIDLEWRMLKDYLNDLRAHGTQVVFFFIPVNPSGCRSAILEQKFALLEARKEEFGYQVIPMPDCTEYQTSDGVHLEQPSAEKFALYLQERLKAR